MVSEKAKQLLKVIDKAFRELAQETETTFISASFIDDTVMIDDYTNLADKKFSYFNEAANNE